MIGNNFVHLIGRLGKDPESKEFNSGSRKVSFSIAVNTAKDETDWVNIEMWGSAADRAETMLKKGSLVSIHGQLRIQKYESKDGKIGQKTFINSNSFYIVESQKKTDTYDDDFSDEGSPF